MLKASRALSLYHSLCLISAEAAVCRRRQPAEPSTTKAQRLQRPGTQEEPEKVKQVTVEPRSLAEARGRAGMSAQTSYVSDVDRCQ